MLDFASSPIGIVVLSVLIERLFLQWAVAQGVKSGRCRDRRDPRIQGAALVMRCMFMALTFLILAGLLLLASERASDPSEAGFNDRMLQLASVVQVSLLYVGIQLPGLGSMLARVVLVPERSVGEPAPVQS